ncbi:MAG: hypothetical protein HC822_24775 [Oscillochloris sp.]|nr:hypothetical protein [Oscillochloris sp.]
MEPYQRQQFDIVLQMAGERFVERIVQRNAGIEHALAKLRQDPQGEGIWLDEFVQVLFSDFLLDNIAGACFVLQALGKRPAPDVSGETIEIMLQHLARRAFADLLARKVEEALEQQSSYA